MRASVWTSMTAFLALLLVACGGDDKSSGTTVAASSSATPETPQPIGHRFERADDWVPQFEAPERKEWQKPGHVVELLGLEPGMVVADLGAGTGYFLPHLSRAVGDSGQVLGLDIEPDMVRHMRERATEERMENVAARVVAVDDPKLEPESVDRIMAVNTWHHIPERAAYVQKLVAGLRPGGAVYVIDYTKESPRGPPRHHRLSPEQIVSELEAGGLAAEILDEELPYQFVVAGLLAPKTQ